MRLLCIGDVCGQIGCEMVRNVLPKLKREKDIDVVIINGENSADTNGVTPYSADYLFACGADVITGGNHSFRNSQIVPYLDSNPFILRPHNLPDAESGSGYCLLDKGISRLKYTAAFPALILALESIFNAKADFPIAGLAATTIN